MRYTKCLPFLIRNSVFLQSKRFFLSKGFECTEVWNSRLSNPIIAKIESEAMYYELNGIFNRTRKMNPIDADLFINAQTDDKLLTEVEELTHKLRQTADTCSTLPTTHHAFIRLFTNSNKVEDFVRILHDRLNYGIFPDDYCMLYMLNIFLKKEDFKTAAKIASLKMFQEDFSNDLVKYMSLYSVLKYLPTNEPWDDPNTVKSVEDEDEEPVMVKVRILRNPFFDDHFDLIDGRQICGKTLVMIALKMQDEIADSLKIMGLALYNKWDKLIDSLETLAVTSKRVHAESLKLVESEVKEKLQDTEKAEKILNILTKFDEKRLIVDDMSDYVRKLVVDEVTKSEKNLIQMQEKLYKEWEDLREKRLQDYMEEMTRRRRLEEVERKKEELKQKEELMYFFDREDEIEVVIEEKEGIKSKRGMEKEQKINEDDYIPPEIQSRVSK